MHKPIRLVAPVIAVVVAAPYLVAPFRPDFDYRDAPESPPLAAITVATSTDSFVINTMTDEMIRVPPGLVVYAPRKVI
jgi:hypothetical protein